MLAHLSISNFAVVKQLSVHLENGLTAITGETGAGKSIAIDALSLCLGERADANAVRKGSTKAEIIAHFSLNGNVAAKTFLDEHELTSDEDENSCFIRRVISKEGRSKAFINGVPASLQQLKGLGQFLLAIHGQNTHLQLLKEDHQRELVDSYAQHDDILDNVKDAYSQWRDKQRTLKTLQDQAQQRENRLQLLTYQVRELDEFAIEEGEFEELETEHKRLSNGQSLLEQAQTSVYNLYENDEGNALSVIQSSIERLGELETHDASLTPIIALLNDASIQIEEAAGELRSYCDHLEIDPLRLQQVEARYAKAMDLARKHSVMPEALYKHHQELTTEFTSLSEQDTLLGTLEGEVATAREDYLQTTKGLSESRQQAAIKLGQDIEAQIRQMNMPHAKVDIQIQYDEFKKPVSTGLDTVEFKVSTNPGQDADKLEKVVSGGELSRIGLAIQVIASDHNATPTMIFDEVDTGISGPTASIVGGLLRKLGKQSQVMCVTHLPQVAAQAHNQLFVTKLTDGESTETQMLALTKQDRIDELARLLAGDKITKSALANAKELLKSAISN
ncbi:DNA repair protein RecN [Alteromonas mediterranea]|jgi:DNA repair protein RecN (Recombination protein N)|uniref:DNA repair protein RecN n=1 Tax=Alteromonas mediterranea TaxID=314275 RepID=A0AAC8XJA9_9ALTE|nr:DNA repair protein RecN [Alteromonas mediterranea]MEA3381207.1 DNA repair protein RecN [Pseudomonadota bacterium]AFV84999.1 DNA repair ATPase RecN [Alteromonas mediterranea DE1]AGP97010.1 DNA repair ATPase RecN [Alteromonas mediterranea UM7]AGQ01358.1 DNA repair ATPase RecN [Alteromonas mediterranea UM4b]AMJ78121.1 DNA repair protein RecN [Alteromonas mediterranea]|tara:strand:- start:595 stop:2280 length:1686 start_codon:yes stop_codon:yes gene_type:complete